MKHRTPRSKRRLTSEEVQEILKEYPFVKAADLAKKYNVNIYKIYSTAKRYEVKKSPDFLKTAASGRIQPGQRLSINTEFKKGHIPSTKGKPQGYFFESETAYQKWRRVNLWQKGNKPHNTGKDGEVRWRGGIGYYFIRLNENDWVLYHRWLWQQENGEIPEGYVIAFKDGNRKNCKLENLECITEAEVMRRNTFHNYPEDLKEIVYVKGAITRVINNHKKSG